MASAALRWLENTPMMEIVSAVMGPSFVHGFFHLGNGDRWQVLDEQHEQEKEETKSADHDAVFHPGRRVEPPGVGQKVMGHRPDDDPEAGQDCDQHGCW